MGKLTIIQIKEIKKLRKLGVTFKELANKFNVSENTIKYHSDEEFKRKQKNRNIKYFRNLPEEKKREIYQKRKPYLKEYMKKRYKEDKEFREDILKKKKEYYSQKKSFTKEINKSTHRE